MKNQIGSRAVVSDHIPGTLENIEIMKSVLAEQKLPTKIWVHDRDPRQSMLSRIHYYDRIIQAGSTAPVIQALPRD